MSDEGFHEIQLNGKQLVFLFMAAAVVGVVVFLSGVMVGRGVRAEKTAAPAGDAAVAAADLSAAGAVSANPSQGAAAPAQPAGDTASAKRAAPPAIPPPPVADDISRTGAQEGRGTAAALTTPGATARAADTNAAPAAGRESGGKPASGTPPPTQQSAASPPRAPETAVASYAVQVAAPKDRAAAEAIAKRLVGKGYSAYVVDPGAAGASPVYYRVRVGPYKTRREADDARRRLEKEEQFKPFITR